MEPIAEPESASTLMGFGLPLHPILYMRKNISVLALPNSFQPGYEKLDGIKKQSDVTVCHRPCCYLMTWNFSAFNPYQDSLV